MSLFRKKQTAGTQTAPTPADGAGGWQPQVAPSNVDWADLDEIKAEWPITNSDIDEDLLGWRNGMRMALQDEIPGQRFNEAEYLTRGLRYRLYGPSPLTDDEAAESIRLVLVQLHRAPTEIMGMTADFVPRLVRLALAIMRERGWQPSALGGTGRIQVDLNTPIVLSAIATTAAPDGDYLRHFFSSSAATSEIS